MTAITNTDSMWHNRNYIRLLAAQITSLIGTGVSSVCLALLAYNLAGNNAGLVLSIAFAIKMVAYIGLAPIFGAIAHRLPKQPTLIILDIARALMFLCLPFVTHVWQVYGLMFAINACSAGFSPLFQSILPTVLPNKHQYATALSLSRMAYDLEQIISPILVALLLTVIQFKLLFTLDAATFIISAGLILCCSLPKRTPAIATKITLNSLTQGISNYLGKPSLKALWFAYLAAASASAMVLVNTVVYVHDILQGNQTQTALALMVTGLGSMIVALRLPKLLDKYTPQHFHWLGLTIICGTFLIGALTPGWIGFSCVCFAMGMGMSFIQTSAGLIITKACDSNNEDTGPYFAAHFSLTHFWWLITYLVAGMSVKFLGLSYGYMIMGGLAVISFIIYARLNHSTTS
ncbi:MFS transporter [Photobacterium andalusiense]|uniref:Major Facilitator Superfamily protein n=1 Tax=Photobacterium andalusiense TaxID=2204296 RepID=A0A1Y6M5V2_9GAMM|nr:MFS transporter [Photobacterium andalusiense]SMY31967.1 Major Facilitator Superfamily protein [Photobacterium andalusiense]